jgi:general secretion pathway protein A
MLEDTAPQQRLPVGSLVLSLKGDVVARSMLVPGRFVIGRTPDNDLAIESKFVSRHHAQVITGSEGDSVIEDLNSTNGIIVGGKRVRRHRLAPGDVVSIGTHRLAYFKEALQPAEDQTDERPKTETRDS